jgi:tRNA(fMet)-specific endonuclease VapC
MKFMLDTDACSYVINHHSESLQRKLEAVSPSDVRMSVVSWGELLLGCALRPQARSLRDRVHAFARIVEPLPMDPAVSEHYADIRSGLQVKGSLIGPNDLWIAAHARAAGMTLVTHNVREFKRVPKLKVEDWTQA